MAEVSLPIGERHYQVACRDGEEAQMRRLGEMLDQRWPAALRAAGGVYGERAMLFVALMLADALDDAENRTPDVQQDGALARIADRLETLAAALERDAPSA